MRHKHKHRHDYRSPYDICTLLYGKAIYKPIEIVAGYVEPLCVKVKMHQLITDVATRHVTIIPTDFVVTRLINDNGPLANCWLLELCIKILSLQLKVPALLLRLWQSPDRGTRRKRPPAKDEVMIFVHAGGDRNCRSP